MKTIYLIGSELFGEQEFFFDENFKLLHWWDRNDASWRSEYMNPLMLKLGIKIDDNSIEATDERVYSVIKEVLLAYGADESDLEWAK